MYNFDPNNVFLAISTNIPQLKTGFVVQGHKYDLEELSYAHQGCTDLVKNTVKAVILWNYKYWNFWKVIKMLQYISICL